LRRALLLVLCVAACASGCASTQRHAPAADPARRLLASITITKSSFDGPIRRKTGFEFHVNDAPGAGGPFLEGEKYRDGRLVDSFDGGSGSAKVIEAIGKVGLAPFDFAQEVRTVEARLEKEAEQRGEDYIAPGSRDGAEWEIVIVTRSGRFSVRTANPGGTLDVYAGRSENLAKLKAVIDLLALYYGRLEFGL